MDITFIGAAQEVTGSCFLVETADVRFLVDCGMFQGDRITRRRNLAAWTFDPASVSFVLLTHAHIDHSGLLPRLCALGFTGDVLTTHATADLLTVLLPDSAYIQESEWTREQRRAGRSGSRHGRGVGGPLYTVAQAEACLEQIKGTDHDVEIRPHPKVRVVFREAGHILGSAILEVWVEERGTTTKIVFSGDLGQPGRPVLRDAARIRTADVLVVESTYGTRVHRSLEATQDELVEVMQETLARRHGNVVIPSFAVGRTQEIIHLLLALRRAGRLPKMAIHVDSPMAAKASAIMRKHAHLLDPDVRALISGGDWGSVRFVRTVEESRALNGIRSGAVIISASGMCEAGRIKHHLRHNLPRPECAIAIVGFQALGTLGRRLVDGAKRVGIFGEKIDVRASIHTIGGLSAHADAAALMAWLDGFESPPRRTFVVHGEAATAESFAARLKAERGWQVDVPGQGARVSLAT